MKQTKSQDFLIRRRAFSHSLRLSVNRHGQIIVSAPYFCSTKTIEAFIQKHQDWIDNVRVQPHLTFSNGMTITLLDRPLVLCHDPSVKTTVCRNGTLYISGEESFLHRRVCHYIQKETAAYIHHKATEFSSLLGVSFHEIHLKDTTSRWGSCSSGHNLNFCWRLGLAPVFVLDYIIAHEVSHLKEMNHSPRFWATVARLNTRQSEAEIWLRRHGASLY